MKHKYYPINIKLDIIYTRNFGSTYILFLTCGILYQVLNKSKW